MVIKHRIGSLTEILVILFIIFTRSSNGQVSQVHMNWLSGKAPAVKTGVSWGVPWPKGVIKKGQNYILVTQKNDTLPVQSWPMAYWPDGSLKWVGFATVAGNDVASVDIRINDKNPVFVNEKLEVTENSKGVKIRSGKLNCFIPSSGNYIIDSLIVNKLVVGCKGRLECILQNSPGNDPMDSPQKKKYISNITKVTIEQNGPVRATVRVQGTLKEEIGIRTFLPFDIRMYFYSGSNSIRIVNTIIYNGDNQKDFIKGLAVVFSVPMREELYNRHVRFSGENPGIWAEPIKPLINRSGMIEGKMVYADQIAGKPVVNNNPLPKQSQDLINSMPFWNDYKLIQNNADGFTINKRTNSSSAWIDVNAGKRASGLVFVGDIKGGLSVGLKNFWESYPSALEINNASKEVAELKIWLWSPYSEIMDMRHYDTVAHGLLTVYEDVQEGLSTPYGIGHTSELTVFVNADVPSNEVLSNQADISSTAPLLSITPEYLHSVNIFGIWSLPDKSNQGKAWIENQLDEAISLYQKEIEQRNWYGFWNYGDVMHAYDPVRHTWNYDIGGYAWDNTELGSDLWLWYSFIRTGRADIFRMAEAMTRHTSEVDVYHIGELAGLGSRHNVRHWGCGSKEVRESQSASRRFYYYLTTDERTGDIMHEVAENADVSMSKLDPLRNILPKTQYPTHIRIGPDWLALVGNWMTEWERTGDKIWLDKITTGIDCFAKMPYGFYSGEQGAFGYDPATKKVYQLNDEIGFIHLSALMDGPEIIFELTDLIQNKKLNKLWIQFCQLWGAPADEVKKVLGKEAKVGMANNNWYAKMPGYIYKISKDDKYADRAWTWFLNSTDASQFDLKALSGSTTFKPLLESPKVATNTTAQWCLNAIELLELAGDKMPEQNPLWNTVNIEKK